MPGELGRTFKLASGPEEYGLQCDREGLTLAGVPLLRKSARGFAPRSQAEIRRLIGDAYDVEANVEGLMRGLAAVARALNDDALPRAQIAALHLRLPALDLEGALRIARSEAALAKQYNPDEPRDWHGRWTREGDGGAPDVEPTPLSDKRPGSGDGSDIGTESNAASEPENWVHLPPGERIDELGDLLEWIANAKPEDAAAIRREIKRLFYDVGDIQGGDALNRALSDALEAGNNRAARAAILHDYEIYTKADPREVAQFGRDLTTGALLSHLEILPIPRVGANPWTMPWATRGFFLHEWMDSNLPRWFKGIDDFRGGIVTSYKSIDLNAATYQDTRRLLSRINGEINRVADYNGGKLQEIEIQPEKISGRKLGVIIPRGSMTPAQRNAFDAAAVRAKEKGIEFRVIQYPP